MSRAEAAAIETAIPTPAGNQDVPLAQHERAGVARRRGLGTLVVLATALAALVPTVGDLGLTWDEPAYRYSQLMSIQWWQQLGRASTWADLSRLLDPEALLYYWPYGRFGINFHPPLAGQLNLAAHSIFGAWMKDIPARRLASVIEFALTITIGFHFLAARYGKWVGVVMAGSLLLMPRLYGQAHLMDTDIPGLLLWAAAALAFWKGLNEQHARPWRIAVGILLGLAFVEKMGAVMVLGPLLLWLVATRLPRTLVRPGGRADWIDGVVTTGLMLFPLAVAFQQILMLQQRLPPPDLVNLFNVRLASDWPGAILAAPLVVWISRRLVGRWLSRHPIWGAERPALETWAAILAFAPVVGWLGNPAWWRETLPRLAHYYTLNVSRDHVLPPIQIIYFGQVYFYSLPWHNAWVLIAITVPLAILGAGVIGLAWAIGQVGRDRLPLYFLVHFLTLPVIRMLPTPAHDGVRLFLPTFFFLAAFAGWGAIWLADAAAARLRLRQGAMRVVIAGVILGTATLSLARIHPYELSYYNALVGGPRGAWARGFELSYWYDAFTPGVIADINRTLPPKAEVDFLNESTKTSVIVFQEQQTLGGLRGDITLVRTKLPFPYVWLLTQDSKSSAFTRLLFALRPWFASEPAQLDGARVVTVADPVAVSRAWALQLLLDAPDRTGDDPAAAPQWVKEHAPWLGRFWGDGLQKARKLTINQSILEWSRVDPDGLLAAARWIAAGHPPDGDRNARRLIDQLHMTALANPQDLAKRIDLTSQLLDQRPRALTEAIEILNAHRDEVVQVMSRYGYTDVSALGGYLDRDLAP